MASEETFRFLLQQTMQRNEGLVKINNEATLAIPTILGALWGFLISFNHEKLVLPVFSLITIWILIIWRYFAHYIDDDIAGNYSRIMQLEKELQVPRESSIFIGLIRGITKNFKENNRADAVGLCKDQRIELINRLFQKKWLGPRGHDKWDWIALFLGDISVIFLILSCICLQNENICSLNEGCVFPFGTMIISIVLSSVVIIYSIILYKKFPKEINIHTYPDEMDFERILKDVKMIELKNPEEC